MYVALSALLGLAGAVLGAFGLLFTPQYAGAIPVPLGIVVTLLSLPWLVRASGELDPRPLPAAVPLIGWVVAVLGLTLFGPGGDVMLPLTWQSLLFLCVGLGSGLWALRSVLLEENGPPYTPSDGG
ncbi:hypothetical protein ACQEVB_12280 [Pseudonocardia sp. CA-107938]|uniref:hypothetical protein n=1 Tax=Pseudonocardia sp. CA-107938 TaxID=3240021 RepID=UPI003D90E3E0